MTTFTEKQAFCALNLKGIDGAPRGGAPRETSAKEPASVPFCTKRNSRYSMAHGGVFSHAVVSATAFVLAATLLFAMPSAPAYADSLPATQTRTVTWLSTDEQPLFPETLSHEEIHYSLVSTEINEIDARHESVTAQRFATVSCDPSEVDATRSSFAHTVDVDEDGFRGSLPLAYTTSEPVYAQRAWEVNETRVVAGLPSNDAAQIASELLFSNPETQHDLTLRLASLAWTVDTLDATGLPSSYTAHALYRGTDSASVLDSYKVTAWYEGEVHATQPVRTYQATLTYQAPIGEEHGSLIDEDAFSLAPLVSAAVAVAAAATAFGVFFWRRHRDVRVCRVKQGAHMNRSGDEGVQGSDGHDASRKMLKVVSRVSSKRSKDGALVVELPPNLDISRGDYALLLDRRKANGARMNVVQCGNYLLSVQAQRIVHLKPALQHMV